jgi:FKBP-type peptidyl-prolyl cis-trans isomerase FklB
MHKVAWGVAAAFLLALSACGPKQDKLDAEISRQEQAEEAAFKALGEKTMKDSAAFLEKMRAEPGVQATASGLLYKAEQRGPEGPSPKMGDDVLVHYDGTFPDGKTFDSSYKRGEPAQFQLGQVIEGWNEGLQHMRPGDTFMLYIPGDLAYGEYGSPPRIPPNQALVFKVELLAFRDADGKVHQAAKK